MLCGLAALAGVGFVVCVDSPGLLSPDSVYQLDQAQRHRFADGHPPVMAWVWSGLLGVAPGPLGVLVLQNVLFWGAVALIWAELGPRRLAWLGVLGTGFFPPIFVLLGIIWKDVQMGSALLAAIALLLLIHRRRIGHWGLAPALLLLTYGCAVRLNGIMAVVPLLWLWIVVWREGSPSRQLALTGGLSLAVLAFSLTLNRSLTDDEEHASQRIEVHDLEGVSLDLGTSLFPDAYWAGREPLTLSQIAAGYQPLEPTSSFWYPPGGPHFDSLTSPKGSPPSPRLQALRMAWLEMLWQHPRNILRQRLLAVGHMFGVRWRYVCYDYITEMQSNVLGIELRRPALHAAVLGVFARFRDGLLYRGWLYSLLLVGATAFAQRDSPPFFRRTTFAIALSGVGSVLIYLLTGTGCEFRYLWWLVIAALLCLFLAIVGRGGVHESSS